LLDGLPTPPGTLRHIVQHGEFYLVPRRDGTLLAGSTVEHVGFDKTVHGRSPGGAAAGALIRALARNPSWRV